MSALLVLLLVVYAAVAGRWGDRVLAGSSWTTAHPALGRRAWSTLSASCFLSVTVALLLTSHDVLEHALMWAMHADKAELHEQYAGALPVVIAWNGAALLLVAMLVVVGSAALREATSVARSRRDVRRCLVGAPRMLAGTAVWVVPGSTPAAWCCPGRRGAVIITEAAERSLEPTALLALVAHEAGHLDRHHHRAVLVAAVIGRLARRVGLLVNMEDRVRLLVELEADDNAIRRHGRRPLMLALLAVGMGSTGAGALGAGGSSVSSRIKRLVEDPDVGRRRMSSVQQRASTLAMTLLLCVPVAALFLPGALVAGSAHP